MEDAEAAMPQSVVTERKHQIITGKSVLVPAQQANGDDLLGQNRPAAHCCAPGGARDSRSGSMRDRGADGLRSDARKASDSFVL